MRDLFQIFHTLINASSQGRFEAALMQTPLAFAVLHSHPLGFKVARISNGNVHLRIHLWSGRSTDQAGFEVHNHSFDLKSHVVEGKIRRVIYAAHEGPSGDRSIYQVAYEEGHSILRKTAIVVRLKKLRQEIHPAGTTYSVPAGALHETARHECEAR